MITARRSATGASRRSTWWRRTARWRPCRGCSSTSGRLAAFDASFEADSVEGTSDEWMIERADGYLTSVADVITVGDTAPPPSVYYDAAREDALVALRLFELIDATTMAGCEWLGCAASSAVSSPIVGIVLLYGQKLLARLAPPGQAGGVGGAFAAATTAPLLEAEKGTRVLLTGGSATARRGATASRRARAS